MALLDLIQRQLDDNTVSQLSQQLGADPDTTRQAVPASAATPVVDAGAIEQLGMFSV